MLDGTGARAHGGASTWPDIRGRASPRGGIRGGTHVPSAGACANVTWTWSHWTWGEPAAAIGKGGISTDSSSWVLEGVSVASRHEGEADHAHQKGGARGISLSDHISFPGSADPRRAAARSARAADHEVLLQSVRPEC